MNPQATLVVSILLAAATAFTVTTIRTPATPAPAAGTDAARELAELRDSHQKLQQRLDALASAPAPVVATPAVAERASAPVLTGEQVAAAVEAYLQKRGGGAGAASPVADGKPVFDLDAEFAALRGTSYDANPELWKRLKASGRGREALARFEDAVKADPKNAKAQMELANACLSYMREEPGEYNLAIRADKAFDDVLAIDDKHWEARFTKAVSYSFWPPLTGKPKQAIGHLETLITQQDAMPPQAHEAQSYLILGNLLESSGNGERAKEVWRRGARRHPDNAELAKKQ